MTPLNEYKSTYFPSTSFPRGSGVAFRGFRLRPEDGSVFQVFLEDAGTLDSGLAFFQSYAEVQVYSNLPFILSTPPLPYGLFERFFFYFPTMPISLLLLLPLPARKPFFSPFFMSIQWPFSPIFFFSYLDRTPQFFFGKYFLCPISFSLLLFSERGASSFFPRSP